MIESVEIDSFRGIKESKEKIDLSEFTLLIGRNNSGKTSLLEALYCLYAGRDKLQNNNRHSDVVKELHSGKALVHRYSGKGSIEIQKDGRNFVKDVGSTVDSDGTIGSSNEVFYYPPSFKSLRSMLNGLQMQRSKIEKSGSHVEFAEFINEYISDSYTEIYLETLEMRKNPPNENPYHIDVQDLGDGVIRTIPVYLTIEAMEPELFLWDDITTSLHPALTRGLIKWLSEKETQFIGATHSIDLLSSIVEIQPDADVTIIQLNKSGGDVLEHTSLNLEELELMMENAGHDPRFLSNEMEL